MERELAVIHSATMVNEGVVTPDTWVSVSDGRIESVGTGDTWPRDASTVIDASGRMLLPGVIDTHVHFRDPGLTRKADFASESLAAAAGGVTSVIDMPNTVPPTVTLDAWEAKMDMGREKSAVNYAFFLGATNDNFDTLLHADYSRVAGIKLFLGSSTGNMLVDRREMLDRLFAEAPALIAVHAESESLVRRGRDMVAARYAGCEVPMRCHAEIRPREACFEASRLAVDMAVAHGARLHLCHLSTADELALLGHDGITSETAPHYLWFDSADYDRLGSRVKCNPAIKERSDRDALRKALASGLIDTVATDHAPHLPEDKKGDALHAASGMPGIENSLQMMLRLVSDGVLTIGRMVDAMSHRPARIFGIDGRGFIRPGYAADLVLVEKSDSVVFGDSTARTRCGWTPYAGIAPGWRVCRTMVNGVTVYDGVASRRADGAAQPLCFRR